MNYQYSYFVLALLLGLFWLIIFGLRKDLRKPMLVIGLFVGIFGLSEICFFQEYWTPPFIFQIPTINIGIEDLLLCFFYGGIAAGLYEFVFRKKLETDSRYPAKKRNKALLITVIVGLSICVILSLTTKINLIYIAAFALTVAGFINIYYRPDLLKQSIINALLMGAITIIWYQLALLVYPNIFTQFWQLQKLSGIFIFRIPVEELIWHASMAFVFGGSYELWKGFKIKEKVNPT